MSCRRRSRTKSPYEAGFPSDTRPDIGSPSWPVRFGSCPRAGSASLLCSVVGGEEEVVLDRRFVRAMGSAPGSTTLAWSAPAAAAAMRGPTWTGNVRRLGSFFDPRLDNARDVWIYLPRSY